ncbi:hypothetical protein A4V04_13335 [Burkholderiales bacterium YL45]|uniref:Uncharacterized protein n=5 Tax=Turicimonas muris TaxID=1796652 RepID=A0A227KQJ7_9BURK|nr:hypothetical protein A4V04_13335 [Burkholderiales bacterium YL45]OXE50732.1 hypothetical protein ADH67_00020 [Turicimonas muris]
MTKELSSPRLRFKKDDGSDFPAWEQCKFGELVKRISGSALSSPENPGVEYDDINSGEGTLNKDVRLKVGTKKGQPFEPADLLYGKLRPYLKNILLPDFSGVAIGDFWVLRPAKYSSKFLFNLIQTPRFEEKANCSAGSKMPRADWKLVSNSIFAVPKDPREAERIGELFLSLNSTITLHQKKLEHFKKLKESLLQNMFPREGEIFPRLRFPEFADAWEQRKLIDEIELFGGLTYSPKDVVPSPGSLVLRSSNVKDGEISLEDSVYVLKGKATSTPVQLNDIIVVVRNGSRSLIGKHAIVKTPLDNAVIGAFMTGIRTKQPDFISVLMDSQAFKKAITENLGATINQITGGMLKQMVFLMPTSETEKTAIGNFFRTLDDAISLHQRKLEKMQLLKKALLQQMFI